MEAILDMFSYSWSKKLLCIFSSSVTNFRVKRPFKDHHCRQCIPLPQRTREGFPSYQIGGKIKNF